MEQDECSSSAELCSFRVLQLEVKMDGGSTRALKRAVGWQLVSPI